MTRRKKAGGRAMQKVRQLSVRGKKASVGGVLVVFMMLILGGCATRNIKPNTSDDSRQEQFEPGVVHFEDGRIGFVLREVAVMDAAVKRDFDRAVTTYGEEDYETAIELFDRVIELLPAVTAPYINLAMAYRKIDRPELAEDHLRKALDLVPGHPVASQEYGLLLRETGRFDEARVVSEQSLKEFPEYLPVRRNLGILCDLYLNDPQCALEQFELYSASKPEDEQVGLWVSELQLRLGR